MQKCFSLAMVFVVVGGLLSACAFGVVVGSGRSTTETRQVSDFHAVNFAFIGDLNITQGNQEALTISGDDNILALIRSEVSNGVLRIDAGAANIGQTIVPLRYELMVRNLDEVKLSGLGNIKIGALQSDELTLNLSGAGSLTIDELAGNELAVHMSGLGNANLTGEVNRQTVTVSGAGAYYARELRSQAAKVTISGLGNAEVWAVETLDAMISGAGNISYVGSPQVTQQISGLGSVNALDK